MDKLPICVVNAAMFSQLSAKVPNAQSCLKFSKYTLSDSNSAVL